MCWEKVALFVLTLVETAISISSQPFTASTTPNLLVSASSTLTVGAGVGIGVGADRGALLLLCALLTLIHRRQKRRHAPSYMGVGSSVRRYVCRNNRVTRESIVKAELDGRAQYEFPADQGRVL